MTICTAMLVLGLSACSSDTGESAADPILDCAARNSAIAASDDPPADTTLQLNDPTGPHAVGTTQVVVSDETRNDPLAAAERPVKLLAQVFYPANRDESVSCSTTRYQDVRAAAANEQFFSYPKGSIESIRSPALLNAPVEDSDEQFPLVLYTHGLFGSPTDNTNVVLQLASSGYVVVTYGITHESPSITFPDGEVVATGEKATTMIQSDQVTPVIPERVESARLVLDRFFEGRNFPKSLVEATDLDEVAMFGHSAGGAAALQVARDDERVDAAVNLDGFTRQDGAERGLEKPFLFVTSEGHNSVEAEPTWASFLSESERGAIVEMGSIGHLALTDEGTYGWTEAQRLESVVPPELFETNFGKPYAITQLQISAGVQSFFDRQLKEVTTAGFQDEHSKGSLVVKSITPVGSGVL